MAACRSHRHLCVVVPVEIHPFVFKDRFLNGHAKWYLREVRIKAYAQFLESYKSVTAASMAASFGVGVEFLDRELSRFIAAKRIHAKIDKVPALVAAVLLTSLRG